MIVKAGPEGYKNLLEGVRPKNLIHGERTHMTEVKVKKGSIIPEHQHPQEQTGYLVSGSLRFFGADGDTIVRPGDSWNFAGGEPHGAEALEDSLVIEVFSPIREDYLEM